MLNLKPSETVSTGLPGQRDETVAMPGMTREIKDRSK